MKIAVYAIALNEAAHVQRWLDSARDADINLIADTGSTDGTFGEYRTSKADARADETHFSDISIKPWRFDDARNAALALVPADVDVCIALDLDEELQPGWREALERAWKSGTTRLRHPFAFTQNEDGTPREVMFGHRIHARHAYTWKYPIHEALVFKGEGTEHIGVASDLWVHHKPTPKTSRLQYLPMLAKASANDPSCQRMAFYYARELMYRGMWIEAIREFNRFLALPIILPSPAGNGARAEAMRYLGRCHAAINEDAAKWFMAACLEDPNSRQSWLEFAENRRLMSDWIGGVWAAKNAIACNRPSWELHDAHQQQVGPYDTGSICAFYAGLKDLASEWLVRAIALDPGNARLKENLRFVTPS